MKGEDNPWILKRATNNFKDGKPKCLNCNKYRHMAKNAGTRRKRKKPGSVSNVTKRDTLQKTVKRSSQ